MEKMAIDFDAATVLGTLRSEANEDLAILYYTLEDLYERKLWHQLSDSLDEFYYNPETKGVRLTLFNNFISFFYKKLNQLKYVEFALLSIEEIKENSEQVEMLRKIDASIVEELPKDGETKGLFSLGFHESYNKADEKLEAHIYLQIAIAKYLVTSGDIEESRKILDECWTKIEGSNEVNIKINSVYYLTNAEFYKIKNDYNNFYRNTLLYLSSLDKRYFNDKLETATKVSIAYELGVAALLGDDIYNFGELLLHDVLNSLVGTKYEWLRDLLFIMNKGDLAQFEAQLTMLEKKSPLLHANINALNEKIRLMSLVENIFEKPNGKRMLTFKEISTDTLTDVNEVEFLVMRALSLGLIKGSIDQISQTITVSWVQPRIMNREQIASIMDKLNKWSANVDKLTSYVEHNSHGISAEA